MGRRGLEAYVVGVACLAEDVVHRRPEAEVLSDVGYAVRDRASLNQDGGESSVLLGDTPNPAHEAEGLLDALYGDLLLERDW